MKINQQTELIITILFGVFAFRRRNFYECINFMEKSTLKQKHTQNEITQTPLFGSKVIEVADYIDLGTYGSEIGRLLIDYEKDNN